MKGEMKFKLIQKLRIEDFRSVRHNITGLGNNIMWFTLKDAVQFVNNCNDKKLEYILMGENNIRYGIINA